ERSGCAVRGPRVGARVRGGRRRDARGRGRAAAAVPGDGGRQAGPLLPHGRTAHAALRRGGGAGGRGPRGGVARPARTAPRAAGGHEAPLPTAQQAACVGLAAGDQCESLGLAAVRTDDAACVTAGGTTERFLFYRGRSTTLTPPLVFERVAGGRDVRVTNDGD